MHVLGTAICVTKSNCSKSSGFICGNVRQTCSVFGSGLVAGIQMLVWAVLRFSCCPACRNFAHVCCKISSIMRCAWVANRTTIKRREEREHARGMLWFRDMLLLDLSDSTTGYTCWLAGKPSKESMPIFAHRGGTVR